MLLLLLQVVESVVLRGDLSQVRGVDATPGTLVFFRGEHSFHRAAPVFGESPRRGLVFTFGRDGAFRNSEDVQSYNKWDPAQSQTGQK